MMWKGATISRMNSHSSWTLTSKDQDYILQVSKARGKKCNYELFYSNFQLCDKCFYHLYDTCIVTQLKCAGNKTSVNLTKAVKLNTDQRIILYPRLCIQVRLLKCLWRLYWKQKSDFSTVSILASTFRRNCVVFFFYSENWRQSSSSHYFIIRQLKIRVTHLWTCHTEKWSTVHNSE